MTPPPYPRIPHVVAGRGTRDDLVLGDADRAALLGRPVVVEEKLDGANVMLWCQDGWIACAGRSGPDGQDRAGQIGPLRAWAAEHVDQLRPLVEHGAVLYAEWLLLTHSIAYDRLPSYLVGLDLRAPGGVFAPVDERNRRLGDAGIALPPELFRGVPGTVERIEALLSQPSRVGSAPVEGVVIRSLGGREPRLAKLLAPGFAVRSDDQWQRGRPRNQLEEASWR